MIIRYIYIFFCFFFFKQKTAYEMRISDWSSDVCSSDLFTSAIKSIGAGAGGFLLEGGFGGFSGGGNEKISKIPIPANDEIIVTATRAITRTPKGGTGLPTGAEIYNKIGSAFGGKQIGRASGRERVWQ